MNRAVPHPNLTNRPAQRRSFEGQAIELALDPDRRSPAAVCLGHALLILVLDQNEFGHAGFINLFLPHGAIRSPEEMPPIEMVECGAINIAAGAWREYDEPSYFLEVKAPGSKTIAKAIVACDQVAFHGGEPHEVQEGRARDRAFQGRGVPILRYRAMDVLADPFHCAKDAIQILLRGSAGRAG